MTLRSTCTTALTLALFALSSGITAHASSTADAVEATTAYSTSADALPTEPVPQGQSPYGPQSGVPPLQKAQKTATTGKSGKTQDSMRPFSRVGIAIKAGVAGAGFDVAVPLARKFNLRGGASFFSIDHTFTSDGTSYIASLDFKSSSVALDWFPFGGAFRLSPVMQIYNGNTVTANTSEPAPTAWDFELGDQNYYSTTNNPVHGTAVISLGNQGGTKIAPGFTFGWGNMIPRGKGQHWSVPFEMGFLYIQAPQMKLLFQGTACTNQTEAIAGTGSSCVNIGTDPTAQANVAQEQVDINNNLDGLRFFPILSIGLSYKF